MTVDPRLLIYSHPGVYLKIPYAVYGEMNVNYGGIISIVRPYGGINVDGTINNYELTTKHVDV